MPSTATELVSFARRLRSVRIAYAAAIDLPQLSTAQFSNLLGVPEASYQAFEAGLMEPPISVLVLLHRRTGVSLDWLVADEDKHPLIPARPMVGSTSLSHVTA